MASIYPFYEEAEHTEAILVASYKDQNEIQTKVNWAATQIQSFFRGMMARKKLDHEKNAATIIQKYVRGWLLRYHLPDIMEEHYDAMCLKFYDKAAARIQATWKGYVYRKYEFCLKELLAQRELMARANEVIVELFKKPFNEFNKTEFEISDEYLRQIYKVLFNRHHLLKTGRARGPLSSEDANELSVLEKLLKAIPWTDYIHEIHDIYYDASTKKEPVRYKFSEKHFQRQEDFLRYMIKRTAELPLPPKKEKRYDFRLTSKIHRDKLDAPITTRGRFVPPIKNIVRISNSEKHVCCKDFDLIIPHQNKLALKPKRSGYHPSFWYEKCPCRQRESS